MWNTVSGRPVNIKIVEEDYQHIVAMAKEQDRTIANILRRMIHKAIEEGYGER